MASVSFHLFLILFLFFSHFNSVFSISTRELDSMLSTMRSHGYNLFSNAITTSDLQFDLLSSSSNSSFTFFAPTDSSLFALAMTQSASSYTTTLRYHCVPHRLSLSDLRRLPLRATIPTLIRSQFISVTRRRRARFSRSPASDAFFVNGVNVVLPGLYYGHHIAVHGLGGILNFHSQISMVFSSSPPPFPTVFPPNFNGLSPNVLPPPTISPGNGANTSGMFLDLAPESVHSPVNSPFGNPSLPPEFSPDLTPSMYAPENENAVSSTPIMSGSGVAEKTKPGMESEDSLSGNTIEKHEPLDWMNFEFSDGKPNDHIDIEDSHPHVLRRLIF